MAFQVLEANLTRLGPTEMMGRSPTWHFREQFLRPILTLDASCPTGQLEGLTPLQTHMRAVYFCSESCFCRIAGSVEGGMGETFLRQEKGKCYWAVSIPTVEYAGSVTLGAQPPNPCEPLILCLQKDISSTFPNRTVVWIESKNVYKLLFSVPSTQDSGFGIAGFFFHFYRVEVCA